MIENVVQLPVIVMVHILFRVYVSLSFTRLPLVLPDLTTPVVFVPGQMALYACQLGALMSIVDTCNRNGQDPKKLRFLAFSSGALASFMAALHIHWPTIFTREFIFDRACSRPYADLASKTFPSLNISHSSIVGMYNEVISLVDESEIERLIVPKLHIIAAEFNWEDRTVRNVVLPGSDILDKLKASIHLPMIVEGKLFHADRYVDSAMTGGYGEVLRHRHSAPVCYITATLDPLNEFLMETGTIPDADITVACDVYTKYGFQDGPVRDPRALMLWVFTKSSDGGRLFSEGYSAAVDQGTKFAAWLRAVTLN